jgi:Arc/MetJ-type ribon-helix-helix transcriptional regulator
VDDPRALFNKTCSLNQVSQTHGGKNCLEILKKIKKKLDTDREIRYTPIGVLKECRMDTGKPKVTIKIPRPLYDNLSEVINGSGFNSVTEFIVYVLRDILSSRSIKHEPSFSKDEIEIIRKRLKSLGYL